MNSQTERLTELAGWIGVLCILVAYGLLSSEVVAVSDVSYHALNLIGGVGIIIDALADKNYQPVVLNIFWIAIAIFAVVKHTI